MLAWTVGKVGAGAGERSGAFWREDLYAPR